LDRALGVKARLIGVNNRNLKTFEVDLGTTERLAVRLFTTTTEDTLLVAESGIHSRADVERLSRCGARAILVGESLMREGNVETKVAELLEDPA
jgi:indole-3-glycerol phosphate synthase